MPNYQNGKIYSIRSHQTEDVYIGSTIQSLSKRFHTHKNDYKRFLNKKQAYMSSYEIVKYDDAYIELIEVYPCNMVDELRKREGEIIREYGDKCCNKLIAGRTLTERREDNKEHITQYNKEYYEENKEKYKEFYRKNRVQLLQNKATKYTCICGSVISKSGLSGHKKSIKHQSFINN